MFNLKAISFSAVSGLLLLASQSALANQYADHRVPTDSKNEVVVSQKYIETQARERLQDPILSTVLMNDENGSYYLVKTISKFGSIRSTRFSADTGRIME